MPELLLTCDQVCKRLACSRTQLHYMTKAGAFPAPVRLGRSIRWRECDVDEAIRTLASPGPDGDARTPAQAAQDAAQAPSAAGDDSRTAGA